MSTYVLHQHVKKYDKQKLFGFETKRKVYEQSVLLHQHVEIRCFKLIKQCPKTCASTCNVFLYDLHDWIEAMSKLVLRINL